MSIQLLETVREEFLKDAGSVLSWGDLADRVVLDVGCGQGNSSMILATSFPAVKKIIAIDLFRDVLDRAKLKNRHPKIEYDLADITNKFSLAQWFGEIDIAVSTFCFNGLTDPIETFRNLFQLLKPNGKAAILQTLDTNFYDFLVDISKQPKWSSYTNDIGLPETRYQKFSATEYQKLIEEIGFEVVQCIDKKQSYTLADAQCQDNIFGSCPLKIYIPEERREEYKFDLFKTFLKYNKRNDDGVILSKTFLTVFLRKPAKEPL